VSNRRKIKSLSAALAILSALTACGLYTPDKDPFTSDAPVAPDNKFTRQGSYESGLVDHVTCELSQALAQAADKYSLPWLYNDWGTAVTLSMTVEDQTGLSPGISSLQPLNNVLFPFATGGTVISPQSFSFSIGGTASVNGVRTETVQYTVKNKDAIAHSNCGNIGDGVLIDGDLKIREFIFDKVQIAAAGNGLWDTKNPPYNTWTEEITFVATYGAAATPTWKLARLSANTSSNLIVAQRTNTNDLVITLGPLDPCQQKKPAVRPPSYGQSISLSQFLREVDQGDVREVLIQGSEIHGTFTDGRKFQTYVLSDTSLLERLYSKGISITVRPAAPPANNSQAGCAAGVANGPLELVSAAMNQHNARVQASAIATSISGQSH
jgi:predicted small lipoprotein YifL